MRHATVLIVGAASSAILTLGSMGDVAPNGLTEAWARRLKTSHRPLDLLYAGLDIQTELLHFSDTQYGTHAWRLTCAYNAGSYIHNHINRSGWNADGSKVGVISTRCFPPNWCRPDEAPGDPHIFTVDTSGANFRRINTKGCPSCTDDGTRMRHFAWDRFNPNFCYFAANDGLYRLDMSVPDTFEKVAVLPNTDRSKVIYSYPSEQNIFMVMDDLANKYPAPMFYFVQLPESGAATSPVISYPIAFDLAFPEEHNKAKEKSFHDIYFRRSPDGAYTFNYGPIAGLGEGIFYQAPLNGKPTDVKLWFDSKRSDSVPYHSHPAWGPGGMLCSYFGERSRDNLDSWGWQVVDESTGNHVVELSAMTGGHIAWDGYDPDFLIAAVKNRDGERRLLKATISGGEHNAVEFLNPHTGLNDNKDSYVTIPRPAQSPDGTKVIYHSSMTESSDNMVDIYVAVARYPLPVRNVRLPSFTSPILSWDPPLFCRETRGYHVYRADDPPHDFVEITPGAIPQTSFTDEAFIRDGVYHYAITSEEWSGLESDCLSEIIRVTRTGGTFKGALLESQGRAAFDRHPPSPVTGLAFAPLRPGVYELQWSASTAKDLCYYNIYYDREGEPAPVPARRIASVPNGTTRYIDWQADAGPTHYLVTAVDRQGNASVPEAP